MKRNFYLILVFFLGTLTIWSCQKEITYDLGIPSIGRLQCSRYELNGTYMKGLAMDEFNSLIMRVRVQRRGTFHIESMGVENGVKFSGDGVFEEDGMQDVKLYATGTPIYSDTFTYRIVYNDDTCLVPVYFQRPDNVVNAVMMLNGQPNTCAITAQDINGLYMVGLAMQASNTVTVHATVSVPGVYSIQTPYLNGVRFSAQGTVSNTGPYDIILQAEGTPIAENDNGSPFYYPVTVGGNSCAISKTFLPSVPGLTNIDLQCSNAVISGDYIQDEPTDYNTHYIQIPVNFPPGSTAGTYNITTQEINGVTFSGSGVLDPAGNNVITLHANGTPIYGNPTPYTYTFSYPVSGGQASCSFNIPVSGDYITATVNGDFMAFNVSPVAILTGNLGAPTLELNGHATSGAYPDLKIVLSLSSGASVTSGTFDVNRISAQGGTLSCQHNTSNLIFYKAQSMPGTSYPDPYFSLSTEVSGTRISGVFSGTLYLNGQIGQQEVVLQNGVYSLPLQ